MAVEEIEDGALASLRDFQQAICRSQCRDCGFTEIVTEHQPFSGVIGGDFFDSLALGPTRDAIFIGDVTGHGTMIAPYMALIYGAVRAAARFADVPCDIITEINAILLELGRRIDRAGFFSGTLFAAFIEKNGEVRFAGAGHPPALIVRRDDTIEELKSHLPPLGFVQAPYCMNQRARVHPGDRILFYTDGILGSDRSVRTVAEETVELFRRFPESEIPKQLLLRGDSDDRTAAVATFRG